MFKLLVVEDEDFIRETIVTCINWDEIGFEVGQAEDGEMALEVAADFRPDAVVTDVRMPIMDGMRLTAELKRLYPETVVVMLSGHDEFKYAQEAMSLGVSEYITKPILPKDFRLAMQRLHARLSERHSRKAALEKLHLQLYRSLPLLRERFLNMLITKHMRAEDISERMKFLELDIVGKAFTMILFSAFDESSPADETNELIQFALQNVISEETGDRGICFNDNAGRLAMIFCARDPETEGEEFIRELVEALRLSNQYALNFTVTAAVGATVQELSDLPFSYETAVSAIGQQFLQGRGRTYDYQEFAYLEREAFNYFSRVEDLLTYFHFKAIGEFLQKFGELTEDMAEPEKLARPDSVMVALIDLLNGVHKILIESGCDLPEETQQAYGYIFSTDSLEDLIPALTGYFKKAKLTLDGIHTSRSAKLIKTACRYIQQNYHDPELSLNRTAAHVYISSVYLSTLFKKELGMTFVDYVIETRLEQAKKFLESGKEKNYEIASRVGYNDPQYFSNCFKKHTGMTPSEYRANANRR